MRADTLSYGLLTLERAKVSGVLGSAAALPFRAAWAGTKSLGKGLGRGVRHVWKSRPAGGGFGANAAYAAGVAAPFALGAHMIRSGGASSQGDPAPAQHPQYYDNSYGTSHADYY